MQRCDIITVKKYKKKTFIFVIKVLVKVEKRNINMMPNGENQEIKYIGNNIPQTQKQFNWET